MSKWKPMAPVSLAPAALPASADPVIAPTFECIYGKHKAEILHKGTAYCRACYDQRNPFGTLVN